MKKILMLVLLALATLLSAQIATVTGLDPNGDGFLSLRAKPKGKEIGKLYNGNKVKILKKKGKYYKVKVVKSGMVGYAHGNWIRKSHTSNSSNTSTSHKQGTVHGLDPNGDGFLSLRNKPKGREIGKLYNGDRIDILATRGKWYKVKLANSGQVGWIHGNWVRVGNIKRQQTVDKNTYDSLFKAIKNHDIVSLDKLLDKNGLDIDYSDKNLLSNNGKSRGTPLYYAFQLGYIDIAKTLINHGADINKDMTIYDKSSHSNKIFKETHTLLTAALYNDFTISIISTMIELGASVKKNEQDNRKYSPLFILAGYKYIDASMVKLFLEHGAKVDYGDYANITPLSNLISNTHANTDDNVTLFEKQYEAIKVLLENGANPNEKASTIGGYTPMIDAASKSLKIIKILEKFGGNLDTVGNNGDTMLHKVENISVLNYLLANGLKKYINYKNKIGKTPIESTFSSIEDDTTIEITKALFLAGAHYPKESNIFNQLSLWSLDDDYAGSYEKSLHVAKYNINYAKLLLSHGADIDAKDYKGRTQLEVAIEFIKTDRIKAKIVNFLISNGATYKQIQNNAIDNYFKTTNNGNMKALKEIMSKDSFEHIESEINGLCKKGDNNCVSTHLKNSYGALDYKILRKENKTFYIFISENIPKIIALSLDEKGKITLGKK